MLLLLPGRKKATTNIGLSSISTLDRVSLSRLLCSLKSAYMCEMYVVNVETGTDTITPRILLVVV